MNIILKSILTIGFSLVVSLAHATTNTYYVTQNGSGARSGESLANAWSVSDFNRSANWSKNDNPNRIDPGDTVYFSGTITSRIDPPKGYGGESGYWVTLDGWEGGTCDPVANRGCPSAAILDRPSRTSGGYSNYCMYLADNSFLIVQDFNMQDSFGGIYGQGPSAGPNPSNLTIRRNYVHNMEGTAIHITTPYGYSYLTIGGADSDGNYIYDALEQSKTSKTDGHVLGTSGTDDLIVSYNYIDSSFQSLNDYSNVVSIHTGDRQLIEYNTFGNPQGQACIALKEYGGQDKIVRFNKLYNCGQQGGIAVVTNQAEQIDYFIYGNLIYNSSGGIFLYRNYDNIYIWGNVIHNIFAEPGTGEGGIGIAISAGGVPGDVYVYNNTISRGDMDGDRGILSAGLYMVGSWQQKVRIKNNIFYYNNANVNDRQISVYNNNEGNLVSLEHNTYFSDGTPYVRYYRSDQTNATLKETYDLEDDIHAGSVADPSFNDPNGPDNIHGTVDDDYTLDGNHIDNGADLSQCFDVSVQSKNYHLCFDHALDPNNTDWTTTPPRVRTTRQGTLGAWERGAYVYNGSGKGYSVIPAPKGLRIE